MRWVTKKKEAGKENAIQEEGEEQITLEGPQVTQSMDDSLLVFGRCKRQAVPKQKYVFLTEKDTKVQGMFSEKYKGERENKDIPPPYCGDMPKSYSALGGMISATPDASKSGKLCMHCI